MTVSRPTWIQDNLPGVEFKNFEPIPKSKLVVIDSLPNYNTALIKDTFLAQNQNLYPKIFDDSRILTPICLINPPTDIQLGIHLGNRLQTYIEALNDEDKTASTTSILIESPLASLAWLLFSKELGLGDIKKTNSSIEFIKLMIFEFQHNKIYKINYSHYLLLQRQSYNKLLPPLILNNIKLFGEREKIFEGCLKTSAKIVTKYSKSKVEIIRF